MRVLLLSLHDVTPHHAGRLALAEALLRDLGVTDVTYLLVPRFHGSWPIENDRGFSEWCLRARPFAVRWCLHGYLHQETGRRSNDPPSIRDWLKRRLLTDREGEFLSLSAADAGTRIDRGRSSYRACLGVDPDGFVAPAWLFNAALIPSLVERAFAWTEDHRRIHDLRERRTIDAPVITWASRSRVRRWGSTHLAQRLLRRWRDAPVLRIAVHPCDFDYPSIVRDITRTIAAALRERTPGTYENVLKMSEAEAVSRSAGVMRMRGRGGSM